VVSHRSQFPCLAMPITADRMHVLHTSKARMLGIAERRNGLGTLREVQFFAESHGPPRITLHQIARAFTFGEVLRRSSEKRTVEAGRRR
jgi:hypothetical protein